MKLKILLISIVFFLKFKSFGNIYFVDGDKTDDNGNGSSWVTAKKSLSSALFLSQNGDEIWVKNGIYYPSVTYQGYVNTFKPREHTFYVKDGTKIYGGFNGTENYIQERDLTQNSTILSGDIGLPGVFSDNCYHVISAFALNGIGITMDGLIVEKGNANFVSLNYFFSFDYESYIGAAAYIRGGTNNISNCIFRSNYSNDRGFAIFCFAGIFHIKNNIFTYNSSGIYGAVSYQLSSGSLNGNQYISNTASQGGAGLFVNNSNVKIIGDLFEKNSGSGDSGGLLSLGSTVEVVNCIFSENSAFSSGALNCLNSNSKIFNNIFVKNRGQYGSCIYINNNNNTVANNIFYFNSDLISNIQDIQITNYSQNTIINNIFQRLVNNTATVINNFYGINPNLNNLDLIRGPDNILGNNDDGLIPNLNSLAKNNGNSDFLVERYLKDFLGKKRISDGIIDIGCYEIQKPCQDSLFLTQKTH